LGIIDIRDEIHVGLRHSQRETIVQIAGQRIGPIQVGIGTRLTARPIIGAVDLRLDIIGDLAGIHRGKQYLLRGWIERRIEHPYALGKLWLEVGIADGKIDIVRRRRQGLQLGR